MSSQIKLSYQNRLFLGLVVYSWLLVSCFAIFQYQREKQFKAEELNGRLQMVNEMILKHLDSRGEIALPKGEFAGLRVSIIDLNGKIIYDNTLDSLPGTSHLHREEIAKAMRMGEGWTLRRHSESTGQTYFYSAKRGSEYLVRTATPYSLSLNQLLAADYAFLWFMAGVTAIMCILGFFVTRRLGKHVSRLSDFAEKAERGDRIVDTEPFPHDELGDISHHIVRLYAKLQRAVAERDREHRQALREQQEKDSMKRRLTNNINHELKTPVASMQLCLETMVAHPEMPEDKRLDFTRRCLDANRRLDSLLADVATLTRMEDGADSIPSELTDLGSIVADICAEYESRAASRGLSISNSIPRPYTLPGNASLIASIFHNLITNAIAYSEGSEITLSVDARGVFTVADNGRGVAPEHLGKIFERFYRIDKGRSRQSGGTGLGLAIVRNAVRWHGGSIQAENRPSGGLAFTFSLSPQ